MDEALVKAGVTQVAIGAVSGWPLALLVSQPAITRQLGIVEPVRLRQAHVDVLMMGGLITAAGLVDDVPRWAKICARVGAWTNPLLFVPMAFKPNVTRTIAYQVGSVASFTVTTAGWIGIARAARKQYARALPTNTPSDQDD